MSSLSGRCALELVQKQRSEARERALGRNEHVVRPLPADPLLREMRAGVEPPRTVTCPRSRHHDRPTRTVIGEHRKR